MFEEEAEEYKDNTRIKDKNTYIGFPDERISEVQDFEGNYIDISERIIKTFKDGATFGYNKAKEWHYVSKKDYPKDFKDIWICFITEEDMKDYVRGWYEYDIDLDEHYFKTSNDFGIAIIKNVYAWMPLEPPKGIKENE